MKIKSGYSILFAVLALYSCNDKNCLTGSGGLVTEEIPTSDFVAIQSGGSWNVNVIEDPVQRVEATGDASIVDALIAEVRSGTLILSLPNGCVSNFSLEIDVYTPNLEGIGKFGIR